ncbi:MAG: SMI1/KNR4 family protein [Myxococcota bacterium]
MTDLSKTLHVPPRYRAFLQSANPVDVQTVTPTERIQLIPAEKLATSQYGQTAFEGGWADFQWHKSWITIGRSTLLGDPYFFDIVKLDAQGDCPVYTCMSGTDTIKPVLCASSFKQWIQILAVSMEVAIPFDTSAQNEDMEIVFREELAPRIKAIDVNALRAGHGA